MSESSSSYAEAKSVGTDMTEGVVKLGEAMLASMVED